ncbi:MAG TPA: Ppx/GppA phosphatase family protein [Candidatus Aquicultor sp.]|jgi:exopolyphosphatase/guanosine-5'-triphosphate,3'-diphosphate pyrophosphatase
MIFGAIDIGTNTVRLLIKRRDDEGWHDLVREMEITRLGEGVDREHIIKPEAMERTLSAFARYKELMDEHGVERSRAIATSAMRDAGNADDFIRLVQERLEITIEVITGEEEGRLTFAGATGEDTPAPDDLLALVVDVGGGSTEYIYGAEGIVFGAKSLDIGSVRLSEMFMQHDPPTPGELANVHEAVHDLTETVFAVIAAAKPAILIAVAGTATQASALVHKIAPYDPAKIHGSRITLTDLVELIKQLASVPLEERKRIVGMHPKRADVIIAGAIILEETLRGLRFSEMVVSERDILDGIIYSMGI